MSRLSLALAGALAVVACARLAAADEGYGVEPRVAYLERALGALRETPPAALAQASDYVHVLNRSSCASSVQRLKVECLMTAARQYCRGKGARLSSCAVDLDLVVSRMLGDAELIPSDQRLQILTHGKDYRHDLARESRRIAGALAVDFRLRMGDAADDAHVARNIDRYCLATGDENAMAWQTCASALVWFIATGSNGGAP
ncbi:MAG TPA: hypothetical protein VN947_04745 [Polyangia bacterium]|nr:hypothetical protein [Polyangia bacterium]